MNKLSLGGKKRPRAAAPVDKQWRAYDHGPINLSARPAVDSATGQKAFVLAFAALAVAGAAYFATVMITPENDPTSLATANASPQEIRAASAPAPTAAPAPAPAEPVQTAAAPVAAQDVPPAPSYPEPVRVKTVAMPKLASTAAPAPAAATPDTAVTASEEAPQPAAEPTSTELAALKPQVETPAAMASAYASTESAVSEGIEAVLDIAAKESLANNPVAARTKSKPADEPNKQVASTEPEMAGSAAGTRRIRSGVNMRAAPKSGSQIIGTIPTNASVSVAPGCKQWCSVSYNGKRGFIYKSFLR